MMQSDRVKIAEVRQWPKSVGRVSPSKQVEDFVALLKTRFESHQERHKGIDWAQVPARLEAYPNKLLVLQKMEQTGGEPDVEGYDKQSGEYIF
jgi:hypothetical protein